MAYLVAVGSIFFSGFKQIILSPTILITDFVKLGGIGATLINAALVGFVNIYLIYKYKTQSKWCVNRCIFHGRRIFLFRKEYFQYFANISRWIFIHQISKNFIQRSDCSGHVWEQH